jgi:hypothetical protein
VQKYGLRRTLYGGVMAWSARKPSWVRGNRGRNRATRPSINGRQVVTAWRCSENNPGRRAISRALSKRARRRAKEELEHELDALHTDAEVRRVAGQGWRQWARAKHLHRYADHTVFAEMYDECQFEEDLLMLEIADDQYDYFLKYDGDDYDYMHEDRFYDSRDDWEPVRGDYSDSIPMTDRYREWPEPTSREWLTLWLVGLRHDDVYLRGYDWHDDHWYEYEGPEPGDADWMEDDWDMEEALSTSPYGDTRFDWVGAYETEQQIQDSLRDRHYGDSQRNRERLRSGERYYRQHKRTVDKTICHVCKKEGCELTKAKWTKWFQEFGSQL